MDDPSESLSHDSISQTMSDSSFFTVDRNRKAIKKISNFTIMVVGEQGLGKSTLIQSLLGAEEAVENYTIKPRGPININATTSIESHHIDLEEIYAGSGKVKLHIIDTPGFQDAIDCTDCWQPICDFILSTFERYFKDECGINRANILDNRVHCCLYFISPFHRGLRPQDVAAMQALHTLVNIVPVIAKADSLTKSELTKFKSTVMEDIKRHQISIYETPVCDSDEEEDYKQTDLQIKSRYPFAVIGSNVMVNSSQNSEILVRGRQYPWGSVELENSSHCDFNQLRFMLFKTHMNDLKETTKDIHYEEYRKTFITRHMTRRLHSQSLALPVDSKMKRPERETIKEADDGYVMENLVDPVAYIKQKEEEIQRMRELVEQMQARTLSGPLTSSTPLPS